MDKQETVRIIGVLQASYPDTYKGMSDTALESVVNIWQKSFAADSFDVVYAAVFRFINTHADRFAPNIGQLRQEILALTTTDSLSGAEAWTLVTAAVKNANYNSQEEFAKLPEIVRKAIGSASVLREYAMMDSETFQSVTQSNFLRAYRTMEARAAEDAKTPPAVRAYIESTLKPLPEIEAPKTDTEAAIREAREKIVAAAPPKWEAVHGEITGESKAAAMAKLRKYMGANGTA